VDTKRHPAACKQAKLEKMECDLSGQQLKAQNIYLAVVAVVGIRRRRWWYS